jgi:hypothetical protein
LTNSQKYNPEWLFRFDETIPHPVQRSGYQSGLSMIKYIIIDIFFAETKIEQFNDSRKIKNPAFTGFDFSGG